MAICTPLLIAAENGYLALDMYLILEESWNAQITERNGLIPLPFTSLGGHRHRNIYSRTSLSEHSEKRTHSLERTKL